MDWIVDVTRDWFDRRGRAWVLGSTEGLESLGGPQRALAEMERRLDLLRRRGASEKKAITDISVIKLPFHEDGDQGKVAVLEKVRFLYEMRGEVEHEQRVIQHVLHWRRTKGGADLLRHDQEGERPAQFARSGQADLGSRAAASAYDRVRALRYAELWWDRANPEYAHFAEDCANFTSQVLHAGGFPMAHTDRRETGWWFRSHPRMEWSFSWTVASALSALFLSVRNPFRVSPETDPRDLRVADVIGYDWEGSGRTDHLAVVVGHDADRYPLVCAHSVNSYRRFYTYEDSHAWTRSTKYTYFCFQD